MSHSYDDTSHSATAEVHPFNTSATTSINISHDLSDAAAAVSSEQWNCTPEEEHFMKSFTTTDCHLKQKSSRRTLTPVPYPYIYVKTDRLTATSHSTSSAAHSEIPTSHKTKSYSLLDNLRLKIDCLIDKVQHGIHWATTYISHNDTQTALEELTTLRDSVLKSKTSLHRVHKFRLQIKHNTYK